MHHHLQDLLLHLDSFTQNLRLSVIQQESLRFGLRVGV